MIDLDPTICQADHELHSDNGYCIQDARSDPRCLRPKQKMVAPEVEVLNGAPSNDNVPKSMGGADSAQKGHAASYQASQVIVQCRDSSIRPQKAFFESIFA